MNNIKTAFSYFIPYDYTGTPSTSGYALPFCFFTFVPLLEKIEAGSDVILSNKRILWDFGDGSVSEAVTARHAYKEPGKYKVTSYVYDRTGESYANIYSQNITIVNYVEDSLTLNPIAGKNYTLLAGRFDFPMQVNRSTSWQYYVSKTPTPTESVTFFRPPSSFAPPAKKTYKPSEEARDVDQIIYEAPIVDTSKKITINISVSGSGNDYFNNGYNKLQYGHLYPYSSVCLYLTGTNGSTEFLEVSSFNTSADSIYIKLSSNSIVRTNSTDVDAFFCGTTGTQIIYYKDDIPTSKENILLWYEPGTIRPGVNTLPVGYSLPVYKNNYYDKLSFSSNGIDGEGASSDLFPISKNKFSNTKIGFVIKVKDIFNYSIKDISLLTNPSIILTDDYSNSYNYTLSSDFGSLSSLDKGGFYKGYIIPKTDILVENVFLSASCEVEGNFLTGVSNTFSIYPSAGVYEIAKKGEAIDFEQTFKDIAFQPLFLDDKVLFSDFLGSIFGDLQSVQTSLGKVAYEKIENFINNNAVLDYCNTEQLLSILKSLNLNDIKFDRTNFQYPPALGRLINILSINKNRLFGEENKFDRSFKTYGYLNHDSYGKNLGSTITINHTVTAGSDIVAFEKFSGNYTLLNSYLPLCASNITVSNNTYILSSYNDTWGWNLVLPEDGYGENISNYYLFYKYIPNYSPINLENVLIDTSNIPQSSVQTQNERNLALARKSELDYYPPYTIKRNEIEDGIINFYDGNNTIDYTLSSYQEWSEKDGIIANIITKQFYSGLDLYEE